MCVVVFVVWVSRCAGTYLRVCLYAYVRVNACVRMCAFKNSVFGFGIIIVIGVVVILTSFNLAVNNERKCWIDVVSVSATSVVCSKLYVRITQNP